MTNEEAIQYLKEPIGKSLTEHEEAVNVAVAALEKQIPKVPIFIEGSSYAWKCPACGEIAKEQHCGECGQKFDWESKGECLGYVPQKCSNCGRARVEKYESGDLICEKCNWNETTKQYEKSYI